MALTDKLTAIGNAIRTKTGGAALIPLADMPAEILSIEIGEIPVQNPALILWDWEGTKLAEYSREDALALAELPASDISPSYAWVDHELLIFQEWNWSLADIKTWIQGHDGKALNVGAIYTTTDGQDHNYWNHLRLDTATTISMQKKGTTSIGPYAFANRYSLTQINIPDGVTSIGGYAFLNCYSLTQVNIPDGVTSIEIFAFQNCYCLTQVNIPDSVENIGNNAFQNCYSLTQINIPDSVKNIGHHAFQNCYSLTQINIPDGVTDIYDATFEYCRSLTQIIIPDSVNSIGGYVFNGCVSLCDILLKSKPTLSNTNTFNGLPSNYRLYVPRADLSWFETETNWSAIYSQGHIVATEDYIEYLESIGFNVDEYKEET